MFLAPNFFFLGGGAPPEFLEWDYKIQPDSDHVAKFQGDRSRELKERVAKQKKDTSAVKHKPVRNGGSGRPNETLDRVDQGKPTLLVPLDFSAALIPLITAFY